MKKITKKFRKIFESYDYTSQDNKILLSLVNLIVEMMTIVDNDDNVYIKKLSSFIKILSSDFCLDVINEKMIIEIYSTQIIGVLSYLDNKYEPQKDQSTTDDIRDFLLDDLIDTTTNTQDYKPDKEMIQNEYIPYDSRFAATESHHIDNGNTYTYNYINHQLYEEYEKVFDMLKETNNSLYQIYSNKILNGKYNNITSIIDEIKDIHNSVKITVNHPNYSVRSLSTSICGLCNVLIGIVEKGKRPTKLTKISVKSSFEFIDKMKFLIDK